MFIQPAYTLLSGTLFDQTFTRFPNAPRPFKCISTRCKTNAIFERKDVLVGLLAAQHVEFGITIPYRYRLNVLTIAYTFHMEVATDNLLEF